MKLTVNDIFRMQLIAIRKISRIQVESHEDFFRYSIPCSQQKMTWQHPLESLAMRMGNNNAFRR